MEAAITASRVKLKILLETNYSKCQKCHHKRDEDLLVLPCVHVLCRACLAGAPAQDGLVLAGGLPVPKTRRASKYKDPRRFLCPVCAWPQYRPFGSEKWSAFPTKLPLHQNLLAISDDNQLKKTEMMLINLQDKENQTTRLDFETRHGDYTFEHTIGGFGTLPEKGQMQRITGMAVDEHDDEQPMVVIAESGSNVLMSFHLCGKLEQARKAGVQIRDVCIGEKGTIIATVAEENYALAKWDSALTISGIRHENLFRDIYGHSAQINSEPFGVTRDNNDRFFVTMLAKDRVCRWDERRIGDHIYWFGDSGRKGAEFLGPYHVAKLSDHLSVVVSTLDHKVKIIDDERVKLVKEIGGFGSDLPDLCYPRGVCVDIRDNIYIADTGNFRVVVYDRHGSFLSCAVSETWNYGSDVKPTNVAVMRDGRLLVAMQGRKYCKVHVYCPKKMSKGDCWCGYGCGCGWSWIMCRTNSMWGCFEDVDYDYLD